MTGRTTLAFTKMHGLGNDFLVIDLRQSQDPGLLAAAPSLCDRHFGVGGDGVLCILPSTVAAARMRVYNADGSEAEMCGNGLRCVARYLWDHDASLHAAGPTLLIETGAGVLPCTLTLAAGTVTAVEIALGAPRFRRGDVPLAGPPEGDFVQAPLRLSDRSFVATALSLGNPHLVIFCGADEAPADLSRRYGPALTVHPLFPQRTNVEFARLGDAAAGEPIDLSVWERGAGLTLACGTGACATVAAACRLGLRRPGSWHTVRLPGGPLEVLVMPDGPVHMRGPAVEIFRGEIDLPA